MENNYQLDETKLKGQGYPLSYCHNEVVSKYVIYAMAAFFQADTLHKIVILK